MVGRFGGVFGLLCNIQCFVRDVQCFSNIFFFAIPGPCLLLTPGCLIHALFGGPFGGGLWPLSNIQCFSKEKFLADFSCVSYCPPDY